LAISHIDITIAAGKCQLPQKVDKIISEKKEEKRNKIKQNIEQGTKLA
jgi:hypothetical protein